MKILITRKITNRGIEMLQEKGYELFINMHDRELTPEELIEKGKGVDAILSQLEDKIDAGVMDAWGGGVKIIANYLYIF